MDTIFRALFIIGLTLIITSFSFRVAKWIKRIRAVRKTMPVIPVLFPTTNRYRYLWPRKWQSYHRDWHMRLGRTLYHELDSDVFAMISLFQNDQVFVSDPAAIVELKVTGTDRFQVDLLQISKVCSFQGMF
jgi:hypothetical protein